MIQYDFHLHTHFSDDSEAAPEAQIEEAIRRGATGICFTDHMDYMYPCAERAGMSFVFDAGQYFDTLRDLRERYSDRIDIRFGMEFGLRNEKEIKDSMKELYGGLTEKYPFDFIIGSTHCLENTDPYYEDYWVGRTAGEGMALYFQACLDNVSFYDCFDSAGHYDYAIRYVPASTGWRGTEDYHPGDFDGITDEYLKTLIRKGKALEYNTAGLKYGLGFAHPHDHILKRYLELGGELLTIGSDGHKPEHIFFEFENACEHLKSLGYRYYTVYRERKPEFIVL